MFSTLRHGCRIPGQSTGGKWRAPPIPGANPLRRNAGFPANQAVCDGVAIPPTRVSIIPTPYGAERAEAAVKRW